MKTIALPLFMALLLVGSTLSAQSNDARWEVGASIGAANYLGDLVVPDYALTDNLQPTFGLVLKYKKKYESRFTGRFSLNYLNLKGDESIYEERVNRAFTFENKGVEAAVVAEIELRKPRNWDDVANGSIPRLHPYVFGGVGALFSSATPDFSQNMQEGLQTAITNFDPESIEDFHVIIPFGIGVRYKNFESDSKLSYGLEWGMNASFSDDIDGVSSLGNPDDNDWYQQLRLSVMYQL